MDFSGIKKAIIDYATELEQIDSTVKKSFTAIANALNDVTVIEDKWNEEASTIEDHINAITNADVKASYVGQLELLREKKVSIETTLSALDSVVTAAGLQLV